MEITLNLLRSSRQHPQLSAYASLEGEFNFIKTPLVPPGCKVISTKCSIVRGNWDPYGVDGYYIGPAEEHYRCYRVYIPSTKRVIVIYTLE